MIFIFQQQDFSEFFHKEGKDLNNSECIREGSDESNVK